MVVSRRMAALIALFPFGLSSLRADAAGPPHGASPAATKKQHRVAVHLNSKDSIAVTLALNNVANLFDFYREQGEQIEIRIVTHGPGLHILREDTSPVKDRLISMRRNHAGLTFAACANTKRSMEKEEGKPVPIMPMAQIVPSGVVELVVLQEKGWSYLRP
jgi:intracellular sulfur oxidation DsrE/DsrF family protein